MSVPRPPRPPRASVSDDANRRPPLPGEVDEDGDEIVAAPEAAPEASSGPKHFPCESCGAELLYKPGTENLACEYCGHNNHIPQSAEQVRELDYQAQLAKLADNTEVEEHATVKCESCGAETDPPADLTAFACVFCGGKMVTQSQTRRLIKPQSLLPFKIERGEAVARFRKWITSLWFAPNELKKYARMDTRLQGIYVPYWTYDSNTVSHYTGQRGEHYWVTVGSGKNRRRVRKTRWYPASGVVFNTFDDLLVLGSESLPRKYAERLEPWDLQALTPYDDRYLSGFLAESYRITLPEGFARAQELMEGPIRTSIRYDIGGDEQRIYSVDTEYRNVTFKHILLPVWMSAYRYREKAYRFLINARTGEVQGERPWSWWKITLAVLAGLIVVGGIVYALNASGAFNNMH